MKKLPVGIPDFKSLIDEGYIYADKTALIHQLINKGKAYFLSRPRRFGKSLLVSTLAALFRGEKELFEGLWIATSEHDWTPCSTILLDFSRLASDSPQSLLESLNRYLGDVSRKLDLKLELRPRPSETLSLMVESLRERGDVVLLIDEYDSPLVKHLNDIDLTCANREVLQDVFSTVKSLQAELRFTFITGVSRFSKVSLFSGMNSLIDISFDPGYATLVGLTEDEVAQYFDEHMLSVADRRQQAPEEVLDLLRHWYDGYRFAPDGEHVFNPWSLLNFLLVGKLKGFWFGSGTPSFAIKLIKEREWPLRDLESIVEAGSEIEANHDPNRVDLVPLLYQTGYLTLDRYDEYTTTYYLRVPNHEVKQALLEHLLVSYTSREGAEVKRLLAQIGKTLHEDDLEGFFASFNRLLANIPHPIHVPREAYYHSILYMMIRSLGFSIQAEVVTNRGHIDLVVPVNDRVYIFEFKIDLSGQEALDQIKQLDYAKQFEGQGKRIILVGVNFSSKTRGVDDWIHEILSS